MSGETRHLAYHEPSRTLWVLFIAGITGTAICVAASIGNKWMAAMALGLMAFFSFFAITRNYRLCLVLCAVFVLPIRLDFHLIFKDTNYAQLKGLPITLFDLVFVILFFGWIIQMMLGKRRLTLFPMISLPAFSYILFAGLSAFQSQDRVLSFSLLLLICKGYLVFLYFSNNIEDKNEILWIMIILSVGILIQCFFGILQFMTGQALGTSMFGLGEQSMLRIARVGYIAVSRVCGTIGDPNSLAMYFNFFLPAFLCFLFTPAPLKYRLSIAAVVLLAGFVELLTLSRGGWVALAFGGLISMYGIFKEKLKSRVKSVVTVFLGVFFIALTTLGLFEDVRDRLFKQDYGAAYSRIPMMKVAFNMIADNPVRGVGLNNYTTRMNLYDRTSENISYKFPYPVHNSFLLIAGESGLFALTSFVLILFGAFVIALPFFRGKDPFLSFLGIGFFSGLLTWIVHAQFKVDYAGINVVFWFSLGMVAALHRGVSAGVACPDIRSRATSGNIP